MDLEVLVFTALLATVSGIIVDPAPLTYQLAGGYASQYAFPSITQGSNIVYNYETVNEIPTVKKPGSDKYDPNVHHPAEFTYASPPVRHAEPINFPIPPDQAKGERKELTSVHDIPFYGSFRVPASTIPLTAAEPLRNNLLGIAYSPANVVSRMSFMNGYGVSYGY